MMTDIPIKNHSLSSYRLVVSDITYRDVLTETVMLLYSAFPAGNVTLPLALRDIILTCYKLTKNRATTQGNNAQDY
jgi:hypothetical protein